MNTEPTTEEAALTVEEAASALGYKPMTVYEKVRQQKIRVRRSGRSIRILREDNEELFREREPFKKQTAP